MVAGWRMLMHAFIICVGTIVWLLKSGVTAEIFISMASVVQPRAAYPVYQAAFLQDQKNRDK